MEKKKQKENYGSIMIRPSSMLLLGLLALAASRLPQAAASGRLSLPPARGSVWRFAGEHGLEAPVNRLDSKVNCGGHYVHYTLNKGHCGVCGDPYDQKPRDHERGGRFYRGIRVARYNPGDLIKVKISVFDNKLGSMRFALCEKDDPYQRDKKSCFKSLNVTATKDGKLEKRIKVNQDWKLGKTILWVKLPQNAKCKACVLRWKWVTRLNQGCWIQQGGKKICGRGYGDEQEKYFGCADVVIGYDETEVPLWKNETYDRTKYTPKYVTPNWFKPEATDTNKGYREVQGSVDGLGRCSCDCSDGQRYGPASTTPKPIYESDYESELKAESNEDKKDFLDDRNLTNFFYEDPVEDFDDDYGKV